MTAPAMSLADQANLVRILIERTYMIDGVPSGEAFLHIDADTAKALDALASRLERMAPHEDKIRRVVTGR